MRRATMIVVGFSALLMTALSAAPAFAGYGAVAFDEKSAKNGFACNEDTQKRADETALQACNSKGCKDVIPVPPQRCAALTTGEKASASVGHVDMHRTTRKLASLEHP